MAIGGIDDCPCVSVIMAAYETEQLFFEAACLSILNQTFSDFEFIIVDDGLSKKNRDYLRQIEDNRIHVVVNGRNEGQSASLNRAIDLARGKYIAKMDADDIALPYRLEIQRNYLEDHDEVIACGAHARILGTNIAFPEFFRCRDEWEASTFFWCNMVHPTLFVRREILRKNSIRYDIEQRYAQDYLLWAELYNCGRVDILPDILLEYRRHENQVSNKKKGEQSKFAMNARRRIFTSKGFNLSEEDYLGLEEMLCSGLIVPYRKYNELFRKLRHQAGNVFDDARYFNRELTKEVFHSGLREIVMRRGFRVLLWRPWLGALLCIRNWPSYFERYRAICVSRNS